MKNIFSIFLLLSGLIFLAACGDDDSDDMMNQVDDQNEEETILTYSDIEFSQDPSSENSFRFFATSDSTMYSLSQLNETTGPTVDLVWYGSESTFIFFESPDELFNNGQSVPGATSTKIDNFEVSMTVEEFDAIVDDGGLKDLNIVHDNEAIGSLNFPLIVLFENAAGKKGAIKLKAINADRLLVDIKVMK